MKENLFSPNRFTHKAVVQFVFVFLLLPISTTINAQAPVTASGITNACSALMGTYNYDSDVMGKPAYTFNTTGFMGASVTYVLVWSGSQWEMGQDTDGGSPSIGLPVAFSNSSNTPLPPANGWAKEPSCSSATGTLELAGGIFTGTVSSSNGVPTLSEWGLIMLALLLMTLGVLYQLQPRFREVMQEQ